jgi:hypothetical protein
MDVGHRFIAGILNYVDRWSETHPVASWHRLHVMFDDPNEVAKLRVGERVR